MRRLDPASTLTLETLPLDDQGAYDVLRTGNTTAVFQFESRGMRELLKDAPPTASRTSSRWSRCIDRGRWS